MLSVGSLSFNHPYFPAFKYLWTQKRQDNVHKVTGGWVSAHKATVLWCNGNSNTADRTEIILTVFYFLCKSKTLKPTLSDLKLHKYFSFTKLNVMWSASLKLSPNSSVPAQPCWAFWCLSACCFCFYSSQRCCFGSVPTLSHQRSSFPVKTHFTLAAELTPSYCILLNILQLQRQIFSSQELVDKY